MSHPVCALALQSCCLYRRVSFVSVDSCALHTHCGCSLLAFPVSGLPLLFCCSLCVCGCGVAASKGSCACLLGCLFSERASSGVICMSVSLHVSLYVCYTLCDECVVRVPLFQQRLVVCRVCFFFANVRVCFSAGCAVVGVSLALSCV